MLKNALCLVGLLAIFTIVPIHAQQDAQFTQYMYNTVSVNPGYAGSRGHLSVGLLYRSQWVGLEGAPVTQTFNIHCPIGYKGVGLGISVVKDKIGPISETYTDFDFSYTVPTSQVGKLSFGLKGSAHILNLNETELNEYQLESNLGIDNKFSPNIGAGVYYHTNTYYAGISIPRILRTDHFDNSGTALNTAAEEMHLYFITGYVWELNHALKFKPAILTKAVRGSPLQIDFSANFLFNEKFILGGAYRWNTAFSGLVGFQVSNKFLLGLAYDREVTEFGSASFNNGSFELVLRYDFISVKGNLKSPRFF